MTTENHPKQEIAAQQVWRFNRRRIYPWVLKRVRLPLQLRQRLLVLFREGKYEEAFHEAKMLSILRPDDPVLAQIVVLLQEKVSCECFDGTGRGPDTWLWVSRSSWTSSLRAARTGRRKMAAAAAKKRRRRTTKKPALHPTMTRALRRRTSQVKRRAAALTQMKRRTKGIRRGTCPGSTSRSRLRRGRPRHSNCSSARRAGCIPNLYTLDRA